eukprot:COSAG01_NODE_18467_length_1073_cov_754.565708_1_plen_129_part_10
MSRRDPDLFASGGSVDSDLFRSAMAGGQADATSPAVGALQASHPPPPRSVSSCSNGGGNKLGGDLMAHHSGDEDERGDPSDGLPPSPELRAPSDSEPSAFGNGANGASFRSLHGCFSLSPSRPSRHRDL